MTFVALVLIQFCNAFAFRSDHRSVLERPFANRWLNAAIAWEVLLLLVVVYVPALHEPFGTFSLTGVDWLVVVAAAASVLPVLELARWVVRRVWPSGTGT